MKKRDRTIVAVILAAALAVGLVLVHRALDRAAQAQAESLSAAQFNGGGAASSKSSSSGSGETGEAPSPGESSKPGDSSSPDSSVPGEAAPPAGDGGSQGDSSAPADGADADASVSGAAGPQNGDGSSSASASPSGVTQAPPAAGGGAMTLEQLTDWMQDESSAALAAQSLKQAEEALAAGVGTADDALRRTFAQSQAAYNDTARRNQLAEEAATLGYAYLRCRDTLALREESVAFYQALEEAVTAQAGSGEERDAQVQADLQTVQDALASAQLSLEQVQADLQTAADDLNAALGNPYGTALEITDTLTAQPLPAISADEAAAQALELRNEIKAAAHEAELAQQTLTQLRYTYAPDSSQVLEQQAALSEAQSAQVKAATQVEADVRSRLTRLELQQQELELLSASLAKTGTAAPEPSYTLSGGSDGVPLGSNLSALMEQWAQTEISRALQITEIAQFNLDVLCFQHAMGVGCTAAAI